MQADVKERKRAARMSPEHRREQLVAAALAVFAENGLRAATHSDLADQVGVSVPTVFHYFPTKDALSAAVLAEVSRFLFDEIIQNSIVDGDKASDSISAILLNFCDAIDSHPNHIRVWLEWSVSIREGNWQFYLQFYNHSVDKIRDILLRGQLEKSVVDRIDPEDAARVVVGLAHVIAQMKFSGTERRVIEHTVHSLVQGYLAPGTAKNAAD